MAKVTRVFIISPVRGATQEVLDAISRHVSALEDAGYRVYWPWCDTDQSDPHGICICMENCDAIIAADEIHIWFDPDSTGSHFDRGMLFALLRLGFKKKVVLINDVQPTPDHKSFENVFTALADGFDIGREDVAEILRALVEEI